MRAFARNLAAIIPLARCNATATTAAAPSSLVLKVGDTLRERRRFTDGEVEAYAAMSGDRNPVHLDDAFARQVGGFGRGRVVHGMLVASLFPALIAAHFVRRPSRLSLSRSLSCLPDGAPAFRRALHRHDMLAWPF